ncbi:hypothetical protein MASR2M78_18090 [Treponema sp.]
MLVRAKMPHIDARITGTGTDILIKTLKRSIADLEVLSEDESIQVNSDPCFQGVGNSRSAGEVLLTYRNAAGITLGDLSERSGIAKSHLSEMENNKRPIGLKTAKKLATALNSDYHRFV